MLRKWFVLGVIGLLPTMAMAQQHAGQWDLTLSGQGANDNDFENGAFAVNVGVGYYWTQNIELRLNQSIGYSDGDGGSAWNGTTRVAADYFFDMGQWQPYIGASIGYTYGDANDDQWVASIEGGVKYFVKKDTYIYGQVEYSFLLEESFGDGNWVYSLGIGFLF